MPRQRKTFKRHLPSASTKVHIVRLMIEHQGKHTWIIFLLVREVKFSDATPKTRNERREILYEINEAIVCPTDCCKLCRNGPRRNTRMFGQRPKRLLLMSREEGTSDL